MEASRLPVIVITVPILIFLRMQHADFPTSFCSIGRESDQDNEVCGDAEAGEDKMRPLTMIKGIDSNGHCKKRCGSRRKVFQLSSVSMYRDHCGNSRLKY